MNQSETVGEIAKALTQAQQEMEAASKSAVNPHFKSKFADITAVLRACMPALNKNGISVLQKPKPLPVNEQTGMPVFGVVLETMLVHTSGEWISDGGLFVPAGKADAQGIGSALTYARRYGLSAMIGLEQQDDDGNAAVQSQQMAAKAANIKPPVKG